MRLTAVVAFCAAVLTSGTAEAQQTFSFSNVFKPQAQRLALGPRPAASCGWYMRKVFGGRYGPSFNRARQWATLPRTALAPGAVVVSSRKGRGCGGPCGHVVRVVSVIDRCNAVVNDNRGTYRRNVCRNHIATVRG